MISGPIPSPGRVTIRARHGGRGPYRLAPAALPLARPEDRADDVGVNGSVPFTSDTAVPLAARVVELAAEVGHAVRAGERRDRHRAQGADGAAVASRNPLPESPGMPGVTV